MLRFVLILAALIIAATPAALGVIRNASFTPETPVRIVDRSSPVSPQPQRPDAAADDRTTGDEDRDSRHAERRQAHNEGDDRPAHRS